MQTKAEDATRNSPAIKPKELTQISPYPQREHTQPAASSNELANERCDWLADKNSLNALKARINAAHDSFTWTKPNNKQSTSEESNPPELVRQPALGR
ncbi:hypothetical protein ACD661_12170 [Legionella lytica]|uniref:Uncharacterized protein n=1 Tax=Legionella lytica TaxID=96232 RepID=A0ABW8D9B9_9GAMM